MSARIALFHILHMPAQSGRAAVTDRFESFPLLSAEHVAEQIKTKVFDAGVDGVIINMPTAVQGYLPGVVTATAEALKPLITG